MTKLYRVDNELLTIKEIDKAALDDSAPLNVWLPVMGFGSGEYCYYEDRYIAYNVLLNLIAEQVEELQAKYEDVKKEFGE